MPLTEEKNDLAAVEILRKMVGITWEDAQRMLCRRAACKRDKRHG